MLCETAKGVSGAGYSVVDAYTAMPFPALPPLLGLALLYILAGKVGGQETPPALKAAIFWSGIAVLVIEGLSLAGSLTLYNIALCWWAIALALAVACVRARPGRPGFLTLRQIEWRSLDAALLAVGGLLLAGIFVAGICSIPANGDSMTYHLSRIEHWLQNQSLAHYPTAIDRQLCSNPGAEFLILTLNAVRQGDYLAFLPQWLALVGCACLLRAITAELGGDRHAQIAAALLALCIPGAVLEGSSTQNDLLASFWWCAAALLLLRFWARPSLLLGTWLGGALGLAVLTKGISYFLGLPVFLAFGLLIVLRRRFDLIKPLAIASVVIVLLNTGHYTRNSALYGLPMGPTEAGGASTTFLVGNMAPNYLLANALKHAYLHAETPLATVNDQTLRWLAKAHQLLGVDLNSPHTRWMGNLIHRADISFHEDTAGNSLHALLVCVAAIWIVAGRKISPVRGYGFIHLFATVFAVTALRWTPWSTRLHLPYFMLWMPVVAILFQQFVHAKFRQAPVALLLALGFLPLLFGVPRSLLGESSVFNVAPERKPYLSRPKITDDYLAATKFVNALAPQQIGLVYGEDDWEYPVVRSLRMASDKPLRFEHLAPARPSKRLATDAYYRGFRPDAVIAVRPLNARESIQWKGLEFDRVFHRPGISVYLPHSEEM